MNSYFRLCEDWWRDWLAGNPRVSDAIGGKFDIDAAPEPYLPFDAGENPLIVLTTNPGGTLTDLQGREAIEAGRSNVKRTMSYREAAETFADYYTKKLTGVARRRIEAQVAIARGAGFLGVLQVECCPWHSPRLPGKTKLVGLMNSDRRLAEYAAELRDAIRPRPVLVLSAVSTHASISSRDLPLSPWLAWQRDLIGLDQSRSRFIPLVNREGGKVTAAALIDDSGDAVKVLVLMQGGNHFPGHEGRGRLAAELRGGGR